MEEKNIAEKIKDAFRSNFGYIAVVLVSAAYISTSFLTIEASGKSIARIIADGVLAFIVGILINRMFESQGVINGDADERVIGAVNRHANMVENVAPYLDELDEWCEIKNAEALARARRTYLSRNGMRYKDYFTEEGIPRDFVPKECKRYKERKAEIFRKHHFEHAVNIRLTRLSAGLLISDTGDANDPYFLGRSKREYGEQSAKHDVWSKLILAILFGYYGVQLIADFSIANLLWTILQLTVFLLMGAIKMEQSYMFVVDEYRSRVNKKTDILQMFRLYLGKEKETNVNKEERSVGELYGNAHGESEEHKGCASAVI